ncbi:MAG: hypothetical protein EP301_03595 [Gammaproteobacteria bacterium]|nr:MAG: hypothetical protein EP301_03595 [Gammaproteobacteria bacterium]
MKALNYSVLASCVFLLAACGGGGGGGGANAGGSVSGGGTGPGGQPLISGVDFREPTSFNDGAAYETASGSISFRGGLSSVLTPQIDCSGGSTPASSAGVRIRWENLATGESGETNAMAGCVNSGTIFGVGLRTFWAVEYVRLELGLNEFRFLSYLDGELRGEDVVYVQRTDGIAPVVSYRYPAEEDTEVPLNRPLIVRFNEPMLESSLSADRLTLTDADGRSVAGIHTYHPDHNVWVYTPAVDLNPNNRYEVRLSGRLEDQWGTPLDEPVVWEFESGDGRDETPPLVIDRWPDANGCDCADPGTEIQVGFGEPMAAAAFGAGSVALVTAAGEPVAARLEVRGDHVALLPEARLTADSEYQVRVSAGLSDAAGNRGDTATSWSFRTGSGVATGEWRQADAPPFTLDSAGGVWTGESFFLWGAAQTPAADCAEPEFCEGGLLGRALSYEPASDTWSVPAFEMDQYDFDRMSDVPQPFPALREAPSLVWTGDEVLLFGGSDDTRPVGEGGAYDPVTDTWREMHWGWTDPATRRVTALSLADQATVWTGDEMIVWGGRYGGVGEELVNRGWRYDPGWDEWRISGDGPHLDDDWNLLPDPDLLAPEPRTNALAVWSGSELMVWGGHTDDGISLQDGGRYDPVTDDWHAMSVEGGPIPGGEAAFAIWMNDQMLVWNGGSEARAPQSVRTVELRGYAPGSDSWQSSGAGWEPSFTGNALRVVRAGDRVLVVGVTESTSRFEIEGWVQTVRLSAYVYDPQADSWQPGGEFEVETALIGSDSFEAVWADGVLLVFVGSELVTYTPAG